MKLFRLSMLPLLLAPFAANAHEYWIAAADPFPADGAPVALNICQGHDFPLCETFEFPDTFTGLHVTGPDGARQALEVTADADGTAVATWPASSTGRHALSVQMLMKHPRRGELPLYTTRVEVRVPGGDAQHPPNGLGVGFEIFVVEDLAAGEGADRITLLATNNGKPAQASLQFQPEKGRKYSLNTDRNGEASLRRPAPGRYLVYASHQGVSGSVTFTIPE